MDDVGRLWTGIVLCVVIVLLMCFLTACENAAVEINDSRLKKLAENGGKREKRLEKLLEQPSRLVTESLIIRSIMIIVISVACSIYFFEPLTSTLLKAANINKSESWEYYGICIVAFVVLICILALVICVFGINVPKKLCTSGKIGEKFILRYSGIYKAFLIAFRPLEIMNEGISKGLLRIFGVKNLGGSQAVTEEEIMMMVDAVNEKGGIEESQAEMIGNIFDFDDTEIRDVMTHRTEMVAIEEDADVIEAVKLAINNGVSRMPVFRENADNISGVVFAKDLLSLVLDTVEKKHTVREFEREIQFFPESNKCRDVFKELTESKSQIAVVVDDYGGTAGIITMEDLLETIVGSIQDEYDNEADEIRRINEKTYDMLGNTSFEQAMETLGKEAAEDSMYDTIGGFVVDLLGHVPEDYERPLVSWENIEFKILLVKDRKIIKLRASIKPTEKNTDKEKIADK